MLGSVSSYAPFLPTLITLLGLRSTDMRASASVILFGPDLWTVPTDIPPQSAFVGDKVIFEWTGVHNVYVHPSGDCNKTDSIEVGASSPTIYTFTEEDAMNGEVSFACQVGQHCARGNQIVTFTVEDLPEGVNLTETPSIAPVTSRPTPVPSFVPTPAAVSPTVTNSNRIVVGADVWRVPEDGGPLPSLHAKPGDTIEFFWSGVVEHNVYIHTSGTCDLQGAIFISDTTGASYTFTADDLEKGVIVFACNVRLHCQEGQIMSVYVTDDETTSGTKSQRLILSSAFFFVIGTVGLMVWMT